MATWPGTAIKHEAFGREGGTVNKAPAAHVPVMLDRVRDLLAPALEVAGAVFVDATLGRAGHARALLGDHPRLKLIGIDADQAAIEASRQVLAADLNRVTLVRA